MIGRAAEFAVITDALAATTAGGVALVIEGDAGMGKSTLLAAGADYAAANGYRRLDCTGLQRHAEVGFAAIHQLVHPLLAEDARALPPRQRTALLTAFGLEDGPAPDRLLVSLAVLGLLEEASARRRLVLVVDDVQWIDQSSADVLAFVARRLTNAPLVMLCAQRTMADGAAPQLEGLPRIFLGPLARQEAQLLLDRSWPSAGAPAGNDAPLTQCVLDQAGGNPLAVIELSASLQDPANRRAVFTGEPLPTSRRVERAFLAQLDTLPEDSRMLLLLIAASNGSLSEVGTAAGHMGLDVSRDLEPLERAGLVRVGGGLLQVRHPLIRSTVYGAAPLSSRCIVHDALAGAADDSMRAAWHRAEATLGPDERVAGQLQAAAERARSRGASAEAAAAMRRAAMLSRENVHRIERLTSAAEYARSAGLIAEATSLLNEAQPLADISSGLPHLTITRFVLKVTTGVPGPAAEELVVLAGKCADGEDLQRQLLWAAAIDCRMHGLPELTRRDILTALRRIDDSPNPMTEIATALVDDTGVGLAFQRRLPALIDALADDPLLLMSLAFAAEATTERGAALRCWTQVQRGAGQRVSPADECEGLRGAAQLLLVEGRIDAAMVAAQTALRMADDMQLSMTAGSAAATLARALSWRGDAEGARAVLDRARARLAADPGILWHDDVHWAAGMAALCDNDHAQAFTHLTNMTLHRTSRRWAIADLAEAAAGCGRSDAVRSLIADADRQAKALGFDSMLIHRAHALLAGTADAAEKHFLAAIASGDRTEAALENARTRLLYGEWLRRRRRITDARVHLSAAVSAFSAAGAAPFTHRAAAELRAAGVTATGCPSGDPAAQILTPQELQIAQMAAAGMTNREIADRIYVSHRTVAAHLYKVFPKLGITSRNQLHAALGQHSDGRAG